MDAAGITDVGFTPLYGLNSQKYGALTHKLKEDVSRRMLEVYGRTMTGTDDDKKKAAKKARIPSSPWPTSPATTPGTTTSRSRASR